MFFVVYFFHFDIRLYINFTHIIQECASTNVKVKKAAMTLIGDMHSQLGPTMKALVVANSRIEQSVKDQVEKKMDASPFKQDASSSTRQKVCLITSIGTSESESEGGPGFEIPKTDIVAALPSDCINRMVSCIKIFNLFDYLIPKASYICLNLMLCRV